MFMASKVQILVKYVEKFLQTENTNQKAQIFFEENIDSNLILIHTNIQFSNYTTYYTCRE